MPGTAKHLASPGAGETAWKFTCVGIQEESVRDVCGTTGRGLFQDFMKGGGMKKSQLQKIYDGKARPSAVYLFCHECMGYDKHRGGKSSVSYLEAGHAVSGCLSKKCPLYAYRKDKKSPVTVDWL